MIRRIQGYGWKPDLPDGRDYHYALRRLGVARPSSVDLRSQCPEVYDQGALGSCTANAIAGVLQFDQMRQGLASFVPSRLFIYYNERNLEDTLSQDAGAEIRDGIKSVATQGAPPETDWPYDIARFATKPPMIAYSDGLGNLALNYERIDNGVTAALDQMKDCLIAGLPFVFGFTVYESFESSIVAQSGIAPMPGANEGVIGGHAVCGVGYDDVSQRFIARNSWGQGWGQSGYFTIPYAYLASTDLASDFWSIQIVGKGPR